MLSSSGTNRVVAHACHEKEGGECDAHTDGDGQVYEHRQREGQQQQARSPASIFSRS